ncbi:MAG: lipoyl synthase [Nitrospiraceae bacterium]|nr:lipoyl synthase [Nitrospiraceae bacterium]
MTEDFLLSSAVDRAGADRSPLPSPKPNWLRVRPPLGPEVSEMKARLRHHGLSTVCEEASCPNLGSCFREGVATIMILGKVCTRACPFCDVDHGRPAPPDPEEPERLASMAADTGIRYLVVTSVDRDDLSDGGAGHFAEVVKALRRRLPSLGIEILVPDFRHCLERALPVLGGISPTVFNHNIETVPRLYQKVRPGADYRHSLSLLSRFSKNSPGIPVKSGIMVGVGERREEIVEVLKDMREAGVTMVTVGQYLPPSSRHLPVERYLDPNEFAEIGEKAKELGFHAVESAPLVRSSYHAEHLLLS